jgi:hypothetical protein
MIRSMWCAAALAAAGVSLPAYAQDAELSKIREEIRQLKEAYERRIETLERRLADAETRAGTQATAASPATGRPANETAFNPALSLILQGTAARSSHDPALTGSAGLRLRGERWRRPVAASASENRS